MNKSFTTMKSNVGGNIQDTSSDMLTKIGVYINDRYEEVRKRIKHALTSYARADYTFSTVAGTEDYVLPQDIGEVISVIDKTNRIQLVGLTVSDWIDKNYSAIDTQASVNNYVIFDSPVKAQPSASGVVSVVSSSASDTTQSVYVRGLDADGVETSESITLTGTSGANGSISFSRIIGISKSAVSVGNVTVTRDAVTLSVLAPNALESRFKIMRMVSIPSSVIVVEIQYLQKFLPLINAYDYPLIDCGDILEAGATADGWRYKRMNAKAQDWEAIYEKKLANLAFDQESRIGKVNLFNVAHYSRETV